MVQKVGHFITFEGGEGTGKSTQCKLLTEFLQRNSYPVTLTREPGGSPGAEEIRNLLVNGDKNRWDSVTEILLFMAARRNHLVTKIWPKVNNGESFIADRYLDSTIAYQGYGYGKNNTIIQQINSIYQQIAGDFQPDLTFILDIDPELGLKRSCLRIGNTEQRFESMDLTFHKNLREGFLELAQKDKRYVVINANQSIETIQSEIQMVVKKRLLDVSN